MERVEMADGQTPFRLPFRPADPPLPIANARKVLLAKVLVDWWHGSGTSTSTV
jgi:hypothetical protein